MQNIARYTELYVVQQLPLNVKTTPNHINFSVRAVVEHPQMITTPTPITFVPQRVKRE
jgi:hypothetical protein